MATENLTLKELFARLVVLEANLTTLSNQGKKNKRLFQSYVLIMVILLITNIFVHVLGMIR